jgi:hypothetical protein
VTAANGFRGLRDEHNGWLGGSYRAARKNVRRCRSSRRRRAPWIPHSNSSRFRARYRAAAACSGTTTICRGDSSSHAVPTAECAARLMIAAVARSHTGVQMWRGQRDTTTSLSCGSTPYFFAVAAAGLGFLWGRECVRLS